MRASLWWPLIPLLTQRVLCLPTAAGNALPIVDLGYERHQALFHNATGDHYTFSNIRYAQPPVGELRFRAPLPPMAGKSVVNNGSATRICPQEIPSWQSNVLEVVDECLAGKPYTSASWEGDISNASFPVPDVNNCTSEDCLFLDVYTPGKLLTQATKTPQASGGVPVLVWV